MLSKDVPPEVYFVTTWVGDRRTTHTSPLGSTATAVALEAVQEVISVRADPP